MIAFDLDDEKIGDLQLCKCCCIAKALDNNYIENLRTMVSDSYGKRALRWKKRFVIN